MLLQQHSSVRCCQSKLTDQSIRPNGDGGLWADRVIKGKHLGQSSKPFMANPDQWLRVPRERYLVFLTFHPVKNLQKLGQTQSCKEVGWNSEQSQSWGYKIQVGELSWNLIQQLGPREKRLEKAQIATDGRGPSGVSAGHLVCASKNNSGLTHCGCVADGLLALFRIDSVVTWIWVCKAALSCPS